MRRRLFLIGLAACLCLAVASVLVVHHVRSIAVGVDSPQLIRIDAGMGSGHIAQKLHQSGAIPHGLYFRALVRLMGVQNRLQWGEYSLEPGQSLRSFVDTLVAGNRFQRRFALPEGEWAPALRRRLADDVYLSGDIPPLEGRMVLPETYIYEWGDTRATLVTRMEQAFAEVASELWARRGGDLGTASLKEAVVLASIIEKETGIAGERAVISAVFHNRLQRGMRLQSDPTVIFAVSGGEGLDRPLSKADLRVDNPYNTYRVAGLPPGPIAYPGRAALEAALNPSADDYLYFVADGQGGHRFANTLEEHNRNVRAYRAYQDQDAKP